MQTNVAKYLLFAKLAEAQNITTETLTVTKNGTVDAPAGKAYTKVIVNVPNHWAVSTSLTNLTAEGDTVIYDGGTASVTLTAEEGYSLPDSITVTGASYTWDDSTGEVALNTPTGAVSITAVGVADGG